MNFPWALAHYVYPSKPYWTLAAVANHAHPRTWLIDCSDIIQCAGSQRWRPISTRHNMHAKTAISDNQWRYSLQLPARLRCCDRRGVDDGASALEFRLLSNKRRVEIPLQWNWIAYILTRGRDCVILSIFCNFESQNQWSWQRRAKFPVSKSFLSHSDKTCPLQPWKMAGQYCFVSEFVHYKSWCKSELEWRREWTRERARERERERAYIVLVHTSHDERDRSDEHGHLCSAGELASDSPTPLSLPLTVFRVP